MNTRSSQSCSDLNCLEAKMHNNDDSFADGKSDCKKHTDSDDSYNGTTSVDDEENLY